MNIDFFYSVYIWIPIKWHRMTGEKVFCGDCGNNFIDKKKPLEAMLDKFIQWKKWIVKTFCPNQGKKQHSMAVHWNSKNIWNKLYLLVSKVA